MSLGNAAGEILGAPTLLQSTCTGAHMIYTNTNTNTNRDTNTNTITNILVNAAGEILGAPTLLHAQVRI